MTIDEYIAAHIDPEPPCLTEIERATNLHLYNPRMLSGHVQGRLLKMLTRILRPHLVLELGTYSAYSSLCIAEGLPEGAVLHTIEANDELEDFIRRSLASSPYGSRVVSHIGDALSLIPQVCPGAMFDMVFIDADKRQYVDYYEALKPRLRPGGLIVADNTLWDGHVVEQTHHASQTKGVMAFNDHVARDPDVEKVILPLRDGLTLIYKLGVRS